MVGHDVSTQPDPQLTRCTATIQHPFVAPDPAGRSPATVEAEHTGVDAAANESACPASAPTDPVPGLRGLWELLGWFDGEGRMRGDGTTAGARHDNRRRAGLAAFAVLAFAIRVGLLGPRTDEDPATAISDLLADLRHLADALGLDYRDLEARGAGHYEDELYARP